MPPRNFRGRFASKMQNGLDLIAREGEAEDLSGCRELQGAFGLVSSRGDASALERRWRTLLSEGALRLWVVENRAQSTESRIVAFNAAVFVTQRFSVDAQSILPPYLGGQIIQRCLEGTSPTLDRKQVARANAQDGLYAVVCSGECNSFPATQGLAAREKQSEALEFALSGYKVKELLVDFKGSETLRWMRNAGLHIRRDYTRYFRTNGLPMPSSAERPWLVGVTRAEALAQAGTRFTGLFLRAPPRFHFSESEQILLRRALTGKTEHDLAASLFISPWTVKKRWHSIYARVANADKELLPPPVAHGLNNRCRGSERKRYLLNYLLQHREELSPYSHSTGHHASARESNEARAAITMSNARTRRRSRKCRRGGGT
jgi:DNA-binding CsgD family transcriptional regulator